jgi:hypothetical protein
VSGEPRRHPFVYATYPRVLNRALRARAISRDEFVILAQLYARADRATWTADVTLEQLGEAVAWEHSADWLRKRLVSLKARGWIDYRTLPGRKRHVYTIRLLYNRTSPSEESLSSQPLNQAESPVHASAHRLSTTADRLRRDRGANVLAARAPAPKEPASVGASRDVRETPTPLIEEDLLGPGSLEGDQDHDVVEITRAVGEPVQDDLLASTDRILAALAPKRAAVEPVTVEPVTIVLEVADERAADELTTLLASELDATPAPPAPPLCRYPDHREAGLDWVGHGVERLVCGVCRPPAMTAIGEATS